MSKIFFWIYNEIELEFRDSKYSGHDLYKNILKNKILFI